MIQRAAKPGAPEDHIGVKHAAVLPADTIFQNLAEHWQPLEHPSLAHGLDGWRDWQSRDGHDRLRRQAAPPALFDQRHRSTTLLLGKRASAKLRRPPRDPRRGGDARYL